jgi:hypothetical protein
MVSSIHKVCGPHGIQKIGGGGGETASLNFPYFRRKTGVIFIEITSLGKMTTLKCLQCKNRKGEFEKS